MKISILCAAQNEAAHIGSMIESVLGQSHRDFELLIVDDRSTDHTSEIVRGYARTDSRVVAVDPAGVAGKNQAWNRAFERSSGDVIMYFGADDLMPAGALALRESAFADIDPTVVAAAVFAKLKMFSADKDFDGVVVPRGPRGSRSGGATTLTRYMAQQVFPLSTDLPNEDIWTSTIVNLRAAVTSDLPEVVTLYRIHDGNSYSRKQSFAEANTSMHARNLAYAQLLETKRFSWSARERRVLESKAELERLRYQGRVLRIAVRRNVVVAERLRLISQASPILYRLRRRFYSTFSGW